MRQPTEILLKPYITEKSHWLTERFTTYVFEVARDATKDEIKEAVQKMYEAKGIHVVGVRTMVQRGKLRRHRGHYGRTSTYKKAFVTLKKGETIDVA